MTTTNHTEDSPLLRVLQDQVIPSVNSRGIGTLIVARPSWKTMQAADQTLPEGVYLTQETLKSQRIRVKGKRLFEGDAAQVDAHFPKDGLYSRCAPILGFVVKGVVAIPFGNYTLHCKSGHSFLVVPGTPHSDGSHLMLDDDFMNDGVRDIFYLMVRGNGVECWLSRVHSRQRVQQVSPGESYYVSHPLARQYLETMTEEFSSHRSYSQIVGNALMIALMHLLLREIKEKRSFSSDFISEMPQIATSDLLQIPMSRAEEFVQCHLHEDLSIDKVAKHLYMSRAYFTRLFRIHTGKTFVEYVTQCRLQEAKVLLRDTQWPINRISEVIGLKPSRFRAIFHSQTGQSPSTFRQQTRGKTPF